jgi:hypothetical protein
MKMSKSKELDDTLQICVSREQLAKLLGCGQASADKIARDAEAQIRVGRRVIVKLDRVNHYLEQIAE